MSESKQDSRIWVGHIAKEVSERDLKEKFATFGEVTEIKYVTSGRHDNYAFIQFDNRESADEAMAKGDRLELGGSSVRVGPANAKSSNQPRNDERRRNRSRSRSNERPRSSFYSRPDDERRDNRRDDKRDGKRDDKRDDRRDDRRDDKRDDKRDNRSEKVMVKVSNLPIDMTWQELKRLGGDYGHSVTFARTWKEKDGVSGLLEFTDKRDGQKVISALDGKKMEGADRRLRLDWDSDDRRY